MSDECGLSYPSLMVVAPRGRGRPKAKEPLTPLTTWVEPSEYERLRKLALASDQSVSSLVSSLLKMRIGR